MCGMLAGPVWPMKTLHRGSRFASALRSASERMGDSFAHRKRHVQLEGIGLANVMALDSVRRAVG